MIQIFEISAPLGQRDAADSIAALERVGKNIRTSFPPLLEIGVTACLGVLKLTLKVSARNRWDASAKARKIATSVLWRLKISAAEASMSLQETLPGAKHLTKEQGRNVSGHVKRGPQYLKRVKSAVAPEDPS